MKASFAREITSEANGVTAVDNRLVIDFQSIRTDDQIAAQLKYSLNDDPLFTGLDITPKVTNGVVKWNGEVGSRGEFDRLIRRSYVTGVIEVDNSNVSVNGDLAMEAVEDKNYSPSQSLEALTAAIAHDSRLSSENISSDIADGVITLTGTVHTTAQSDAAELTARVIPGVLSVSNRIFVQATENFATNQKVFNSASAKPVQNPNR